MFDWLFPNTGPLGHIYADNIISEMKGMSLAKAYQLVEDAFEHAYVGKGGVTENDLKQLKKVVVAYGKQFKINVDNVTHALDISKDSTPENIKIDFDISLDYLSPEYLTGSITGDKVYAEYSTDKKNTNWKDPTNDPNYKAPSTNTNTNTNKPTNNSGTGSTSSGTTSNKTPTSTPATGGATANRAPTSTNNNSNTNTENTIEKPVYEGAEAVAKAHEIDYNLANILADYNQRTNDYYDATAAEYNADRTRYVQASNNYANRIMNEYLEGYSNAAATAAGRGATAASALMTDLNTQAVNTANDLGMLQSINNLNEARKAELVKNKFLAEQYYNDLGTYLSQVSTAQYGADVNKYVKEMDAYAQQYAADRALAENQAREASTKYAGLANANLYKSQQTSSTANWQRLYNYYLARYNGNEQMAASAVNKNLGAEGGSN